MSIETTKEVMTRYFDSDHSDNSMMAKDVVFTMMATGDTYKGPEAVQGMLDYTYHVAFDAHAEPRTLLFDDSHAVWEGHFVGKQIGEFAGVPATGKDVCVPLCIVYDLEGDEITRARVYLEMPVLLAQLGTD